MSADEPSSVMCPFCREEMLPGRIKLRGTYVYPTSAWLDWESAEGRRSAWTEVLGAGTFRRPRRPAWSCPRCKSLVVPPRTTSTP